MPGSVGQPTMAWAPWVAVKATAVETGTRTNDSADLGMGRWANTPGTQNAEWTVDLYLDSVTWKYTQVYMKQSDGGISTIQLDGVTQGTIDHYDAGTVRNNYAELTGLSVATAGVKTFKTLVATKNASSSAYRYFQNSVAWIRTGGTASTPAGTDTPGHTWEWVHWMGNKGAVGTVARNQDSTILSGGYTALNVKAQNNEINTDMWADTGTYKASLVHWQETDAGIYTHRFDTTSLGTIDGYGAAVKNVYSEITGITNATAGVKNFRLVVETKNASSSNYGANISSSKVIRTGA